MVDRLLISWIRMHSYGRLDGLIRLIGLDNLDWRGSLIEWNDHGRVDGLDW